MFCSFSVNFVGALSVTFCFFGYVNGMMYSLLFLGSGIVRLILRSSESVIFVFVIVIFSVFVVVLREFGLIVW